MREIPARRHGGNAPVYVRPVIIAVDELDKMSDAVAVRKLLRDVKGVFDIPGVHFLVSVSHEAEAALKLGGLTERNEFNSSFYSVIEVPGLGPQECRDLLGARVPGLSANIAAALGVLALGNARELVRLSDVAVGISDPAALRFRDALRTVLVPEVAELRDQIVTHAFDSEQARLMSDVERVGAYGALAPERLTEQAFPSFARGVLTDEWDPTWAQEHWHKLFAERWRRALVRIHVTGQMLENADDLNHERMTALMAITTTNARSAAVARSLLESHINAMSSPK